MRTFESKIQQKNKRIQHKFRHFYKKTCIYLLSLLLRGDEMLSDVGGGALRVFWTSSLYLFLLKKIGFALRPDIMLSHTLM